MWIHCEAARYSDHDNPLSAAADDVEAALDLGSDIDHALALPVLTAVWHDGCRFIAIALDDHGPEVLEELPTGWALGLPRPLKRTRR
jgi:hypothetical protein